MSAKKPTRRSGGRVTPKGTHATESKHHIDGPEALAHGHQPEVRSFQRSAPLRQQRVDRPVSHHRGNR